MEKIYSVIDNDSNCQKEIDKIVKTAKINRKIGDKNVNFNM